MLKVNGITEQVKRLLNTQMCS